MIHDLRILPMPPSRELTIQPGEILFWMMVNMVPVPRRLLVEMNRAGVGFHQVIWVPDMWRVTDAAKRWFPREVF